MIERRLASCQAIFVAVDPATPHPATPYPESPFSATTLNVLVLQQLQELRRGLNPRQLRRHIGLLRKLGDLAEDREILVGDLEGRGDDQEEVIDWLAVDRVEVDAFELPAERDAELTDRQGPRVRDGDVLADARRPERLAALQHLHQRLLRLVVELEQTDELLEDVVLARALEVQVDRVVGEEITQAHVESLRSKRRRNVMIA